MPASDTNDLPLLEHVDYVVENGLLVFTAAYLLRRGDCCDNGCRHCPYGRSPADSDDGVPDVADS